MDIDSLLVLKRPINETCLCIDNLDLTVLKAKMCKDNIHGGFSWPEDAALIAIDGYRAFLKKIATYFFMNQTITKPVEHIEEYMRHSAGDSIPFMAIDITWHTHILFTEKYFEDCGNIFGFYLHHSPEI